MSLWTLSRSSRRRETETAPDRSDNTHGQITAAVLGMACPADDEDKALRSIRWTLRAVAGLRLAGSSVWWSGRPPLRCGSGVRDPSPGPNLAMLCWEARPVGRWAVPDGGKVSLP